MRCGATLRLLAVGWLLAAACGGRSVGSGADGGVSGAPPGNVRGCAPMDARSSGDDCASIVGYAFDGGLCAPVVCGCLGAECAGLFDSVEACDRAHGACYARTGISRECKTHADCELVSRTCCAPCETSTPDDLLAVKKGGPSLRVGGVCRGDSEAPCRPCSAVVHLPSVYPACVDGWCQTLDVTAQASCSTGEDCRLTTKDCCACGGDFSADGLIAVNASFRAPDYCPAQLACPECEGGPVRSESAVCYPGTQLCGTRYFQLN